MTKNTKFIVLTSASILLAAADVVAQPTPPPVEPSTPGASSPASAATPGTPPAAPGPAGPAEVKPAAPATAQFALSKWTLTIYGMAEFNVIRDSTQSFPDSGIGATLVKRDDLAPDEARHGRLQLTTRNSRLGFRAVAPEYMEMRPSAVVEMDFFGLIPPGTSESATLSSGTFRMRLANIKVETDHVDVLAGQTYHLFGWMPYFYPCTVSFFPMPNMAFGRQPQLRLSRTFKTDQVNIDVGAAAVRPPQSNSDFPDLQGGLKLGLNTWKGIHSLGAGSAIHDPLSIGVSGAFRRFRVNSLAAGPARSANSADGYGISIDAFAPVIPASSVEKRANALSLTGSFVAGTGIGDLGGFISASPFPAPPNPSGETPPPAYVPNIDNGLVTYDVDGDLHTINWRSYMAGAQYYLPPSGRFYVAANYTAGRSNNITRYLTAENRNRVVRRARYIDSSLFFDLTPAIRTALLYGYYRQTYGDGKVAENHRAELAAYCFF